MRKQRFTELLNFFREYESYFILPRQNPAVDNAWLAFPLVVRDDAPFTRFDFARYLESRNIQTRPIFTGNALRQPAFRSIESRSYPGGFPVADQVMRGSVLLGCHQGMTDEQMAHVKESVVTFLHQRTFVNPPRAASAPRPLPSRMDWNGKRILVTGATGMIGKHLVERLQREGAIVYSLARRAHGTHVVTTDLSDIVATRAALRDMSFDTVFHLAASGVHPGASQPSDVMRVNAGGTENLLAVLEEMPECPVVVAGSWTEYGATADGVMREESVCTPASPYGISKLASTLAARAWSLRTGRPLTILRFFSVIGEGELPSRLGPAVFRALVSGHPPQLVDPASERDFVDVRDVVEALIRAASLRESGVILNVGTGISTSIGDFVATMQRHLGTDISPAINPSTSRPWDVPVSRASTEKLEAALGWKPSITLEHMMPDLIRHFSSRNQ